MLAIAHALLKRGVVGMNRRNGEIILPYNQRHLYPLVDNKVKTKNLALQAGLAVPPLYGVIESHSQLKRVGDIIRDKAEFVIKPAQGAGGDGIIVITGRFNDHFQKPNGKIISAEDIAFHIQNALGGAFSLGGQPDAVMIEYCVKTDSTFERIAYQGVPDVRVIVFLGIPIMAMVRLPTRSSGGRANLHQGAIGAGVDMSNGKTLDAVWLNRIITRHPDTHEPVRDIQIPGWDSILDISARAYELTGLGYQGVDIVLDNDLGPLVLELNARPGLNIQIANRAGLQPRIDKVLASGMKSANPKHRVEFAKEQFVAGADQE